MGAERLAVFAGSTDITDLFQPTGTGLRMQEGVYPLPEQGRELTVYLITPAGDWIAVLEAAPAAAPAAQLPSLGELAAPAWWPRLNLGVKAQVAQGRRPEAAIPERRTFQDLTGSLGLAGQQVVGGATLDGQVDMLGVSRRAEALRYGVDQDSARKFDLTAYNMGLSGQIYRMTLGHQVHGTHRLLFSQFDSRGIAVHASPVTGTDVGLLTLNGVRIVGFDNLLGVGESDNRVYGITLGQELMPSRPQTLRLEVSAVDASRRPESNFNQASVTDAERSQGLGLRLLATALDGRLRLDGGFARSRFENPDDPLLRGDSNLVNVQPETRSARYVDASYALLQGVSVGANQQANLSLALRHYRTPQLYRSIGAMVQSDQEQNQFEVTGSVAAVNLQYVLTRTQDNLDALPSVLTTLTRAHALNLSMPLGPMLGDAQSPSAGWPTLGYRLDQNHQRGAGVSVNSEFAPSHVPNQLNRGHYLTSDWAGQSWRVGYRIGFARQDNRQIGRERADFHTRTQGLNQGYLMGQSFDLQSELGEDPGDSRETSLVSLTHRLTLTMNWRASERLAFNGSVSVDRTTDNQNQNESENHTLSLQASYDFRLKFVASREIPVQWFLRYGQQQSSYLSNVFGIPTDTRLWTVNTGLNIALF